MDYLEEKKTISWSEILSGENIMKRIKCFEILEEHQMTTNAPSEILASSIHCKKTRAAVTWPTAVNLM